MTVGTPDPETKLRRAERHVAELKDAIDTYRVDGSFHVHEVPHATASAVDLILQVDTPPPLAEWSAIVGDCIHNIRTSLEYLAWTLDSKPTTGPGGTTFPILTKAPPVWPTPAVARMPSLVYGPLAALQPFTEQTPDRVARHPLATLHTLDITDKHHVLIAAVGVIGGESIGGVPFGASVDYAVFPLFESGARIATVTCPTAVSRALTVDVAFDVVLVDPPWATASVVWVLEELLLGWISRTVVTPLLRLAKAD